LRLISKLAVLPADETFTYPKYSLNVNSICCSSFVSFSDGRITRTIAKKNGIFHYFFSLDFDALSDGS
jgi:hypothetical protein